MHRRGAGFWLGVFGGLLLLLAALGILVGGIFDLALGHLGAGALLDKVGMFFVELVLGFLMIILAAVGSRSFSDSHVGAGVGLIVLAVATWVFVGVSVLLLLGGLLGLLGGIFLLVERR